MKSVLRSLNFIFDPPTSIRCCRDPGNKVFAADNPVASEMNRLIPHTITHTITDMANAKIDSVGQADLPVIADLYNQMFRPQHDVEFFSRRLLGRYQPLLLIASLDNVPVGFYTGFELKPGTFFSWLYGVLPEYRRIGIASQLMDASHAWATERNYETMRYECYNQHRAMLHLAIAKEYDIVGIRWDSDRGNNLVIFEKSLTS